MRIFIAGSTGVLGIRVVPLLVAEGHEVWGMTRTPSKADGLRALGAEPSVCDAYDLPALRDAVLDAHPEMLMHLLTDLPDDVSAVDDFTDANALIRREGTRNGSALHGRPTPPASSRRAWPGSSPATAAGRSRNSSERSCTSEASCCGTGSSTDRARTTRGNRPRHRGSTSTRPHGGPSRRAPVCSRSSTRSSPAWTTDRSRTPRRGPSGPWPTSDR